MTSTVWKSTCGSDCALARWDDDVVVFHRPSGLTHLINSGMAQLLADLSGGPRDTDWLVGQFMGTPESLQDPSAIRDRVLSVLFRLEELGLIERVPATRRV